MNPYEDGLMTIPEKNSMGTCMHMRLEAAATMTLQKIQVRAACSCFLGLDLLSFECSMFLLSCWLLDFQNWKGSGMI